MSIILRLGFVVALCAGLTLTPRADAHTLVADRAELKFELRSSAFTPPPPYHVLIASSDASRVDFTVTTEASADWLHVSPDTGSTPQALVVAVDPSVLDSIGAFESTITIQPSDGSPVLRIPVMASVSVVTPQTQQFAIEPSSISFAIAPGNTSVKRFSFVFLPGAWSATSPTVTVSPRLSSGGSWLSVGDSPPNSEFETTVTAGTVPLAVNTTGLTAGTYDGVVLLTCVGCGVPTTLSVTLSVPASPTLTASTDALVFNRVAHASDPAAQTVYVTTSDGTPVSCTTTSTVTSAANWLTVNSSTCAAPGALRIEASAQNLDEGDYTGAVTISSDALHSTITLDVTLRVLRDRSSYSLMNAASFSERLASGMIASIIGPLPATTAAVWENGPMPFSLAGIRVTLDDASGKQFPGGLYAVSPAQINFRIPDEASAGAARVTIWKDQTVVTDLPIYLSATSPGLFTADSGGSGPPAAIAVQYDAAGVAQTTALFNCKAGACRAAPIDVSRGSVYVSLFGTGVRNRSSLNNVKCVIGGASVPVTYAGPQSQYPGLDQVDIHIPQTFPLRGELDLVLEIDGVASNSATIALQ